MDEFRRKFDVFLRMNHGRARTTDEPVAQMQFWSESMAPDQPLILFTRDDILACDELDRSSPLVIHLLHQLSTYDCTRERVVGLIFDKKNVLSEVLKMPKTAKP